MTSIPSGPETRILLDWRLYLAGFLLVLAAFPIQIYAMAGFEVTPSLILTAVIVLLFDPRDRLHVGVLVFLVFCLALALFGMVGPEGVKRNILGAASYASGAPYILVGMVIASRGFSHSGLLKFMLPATVAMTLIFTVDMFLTNGNIVQAGYYSSVSYVHKATTYIQSFFPFYGKYAVITLATITMAVGALSLGSVSPSDNRYIKVIIILCSSAMLFYAFSMWTRQVMLGVAVFYCVLIMLAFRHKVTWISLAIFLCLTVTVPGLSSVPDGAQHLGQALIAKSKAERTLHNLEQGDLDDLSTGRMEIYRSAIHRLSPRIFLAGCGFCNLKSVLKFEFSSLHNVPLNAIYKGGIVYAILYLGAAFGGLLSFWTHKKSFARDVSIAVLVSIGVQSIVNDVLYFQVIPALLFSLSGYLLASRRTRWNENG